MAGNECHLGHYFERVFEELMELAGLECGKDYQKCGLNEPDYFFPKSKTYVEVKFTSAINGIVSESQKQNFQKLIDQGFKVKIITFKIDISEIFETDYNSLLSFIKFLDGTKEE